MKILNKIITGFERPDCNIDVTYACKDSFLRKTEVRFVQFINKKLISVQTRRYSKISFFLVKIFNLEKNMSRNFLYEWINNLANNLHEDREEELTSKDILTKFKIKL